MGSSDTIAQTRSWFSQWQLHSLKPWNIMLYSKLSICSRLESRLKSFAQSGSRRRCCLAGGCFSTELATWLPSSSYPKCPPAWLGGGKCCFADGSLGRCALERVYHRTSTPCWWKYNFPTSWAPWCTSALCITSGSRLVRVVRVFLELQVMKGL